VASGRGKYTKANPGDVYEGEYSNDVKHGNGKYTYANGDTFDGKYENGRWKFGQFTVGATGEQQIFKDGSFIHSTSSPRKAII
jgi:hypothetical protein